MRRGLMYLWGGWQCILVNEGSPGWWLEYTKGDSSGRGQSRDLRRCHDVTVVGGDNGRHFVVGGARLATLPVGRWHSPIWRVTSNDKTTWQHETPLGNLTKTPKKSPTIVPAQTFCVRTWQLVHPKGSSDKNLPRRSFKNEKHYQMLYLSPHKIPPLSIGIDGPGRGSVLSSYYPLPMIREFLAPTSHGVLISCISKPPANALLTRF